MVSLRDWLSEAPFTLTMSSGFFSFFAHCGLVTVLEEEGIRPAKITGSSAGALVGGCWAAGLAAKQLKTILFELKKQDFWDPGIGFGLLKGARFRSILNEILPVSLFEQCPTPLAVSAFDGVSRKTVTLNQGPLIDAIYASCAVPLMFHPIRIQGRLLWDGGVSDRPGIAGAGSHERIFYHHIATRSPWRRKKSLALALPERARMQTLSILNLPRVGPNRLAAGQDAFHYARAMVQKALDLPVGQALVL